MNEPHRGYVELLSPYSWDFNTDLAIGYFPSAVQSCVFPRSSLSVPLTSLDAQLGPRTRPPRSDPSLRPLVPRHLDNAPRPPPSSSALISLALPLLSRIPEPPDELDGLHLARTWGLGMG